MVLPRGVQKISGLVVGLRFDFFHHFSHHFSCFDIDAPLFLPIVIVYFCGPPVNNHHHHHHHPVAGRGYVVLFFLIKIVEWLASASASTAGCGLRVS